MDYVAICKYNLSIKYHFSFRGLCTGNYDIKGGGDGETYLYIQSWFTSNVNFPIMLIRDISRI